MIEAEGRFDWPRLAAGVAILLIGLVLLLDIGNIVEGVRVAELWPLILIGIGVARLVGGESGDRRSGALTLTFIGCWLLVASLGLWGLGYSDSWPLSLVAVGLAVLLTARTARRFAKGLFLMLLGSWLQVSVLGLWGLTLEASWPFAIIGLGLWIAVTAVTGPDEAYCKACDCSEEER